MKTRSLWLVFGLILVVTVLRAAQLTINIGTSPNDATGDTLRNAFGKVNTNFSEVYGWQTNGMPYTNKSTNPTATTNTFVLFARTNAAGLTRPHMIDGAGNLVDLSAGGGSGLGDILFADLNSSQFQTNGAPYEVQIHTNRALLWGINVKDPPYLAVGDGANDDTLEIQTAINAAQLSTRPFFVYIPAGLYNISSTLTITNSNVRLVGDGITASVLHVTTSGIGQAVLVNTSTSVKVYNVEMHKLRVQATAALASPPIGITFRNASECLVRDCYFGANLAEGVRVDACELVRVLRSTFSTSALGIYQTVQNIGGFGLANVWASHLLFYQTTNAAVRIDGASSKSVYRDSWIESTQRGFDLLNRATNSVEIDQLTIQGNQFQNVIGQGFNTGRFIVASATGTSNSFVLLNLSVLDNRSSTASTSNAVEFIKGANTNNATLFFNTRFDNNMFAAVTNSAIYGDFVTRVHPANNWVQDGLPLVSGSVLARWWSPTLITMEDTNRVEQSILQRTAGNDINLWNFSTNSGMGFYVFDTTKSFYFDVGNDGNNFTIDRNNIGIPTSATPTTGSFAQLAGDNNAWASGRGAIQTFDGTTTTFLLGTQTSDTPANGEVPKWNTGGTITWEDVGPIVSSQISNGTIVDDDISSTGITTRSKLPAAIAYEDEANTFTQGQTFSGNTGEAIFSGPVTYSTRTNTTTVLDWRTNTHVFTLTGNLTVTFANVAEGRSVFAFMWQDTTGGRSVTWPTGIRWPSTNGTTALSVGTNAGEITLVGFTRVGSSNVCTTFVPWANRYLTDEVSGTATFSQFDAAHSDVQIGTPSVNQVFTYNGTVWTNLAATGGSFTGNANQFDNLGGVTNIISGALVTNLNFYGSSNIIKNTNGLAIWGNVDGSNLVKIANGTWNVSTPVAYVRPIGTNQNMPFDVMPSGSFADGRKAWIDIASSDVESDSVNWEALHLECAAIAPFGQIYMNKGGTGTIRDMVMQGLGGNVGIGTNNMTIQKRLTVRSSTILDGIAVDNTNRPTYTLYTNNTLKAYAAALCTATGDFIGSVTAGGDLVTRVEAGAYHISTDAGTTSGLKVSGNGDVKINDTFWVVGGLTNDAGIYFEGTTGDANELLLTVTDPASDLTVTLPNATTTLVGRDTTDTLTGKTIDAAGTGNVIKSKGYLYLGIPNRNATGVNYNTNDVSLATFMRPNFDDATDEASNYVEWYINVPDDLDTAVDLRGRVTFELTAADTGTQRYVASHDDVAASAAYAGTMANAVNMDAAADASGASGDVEQVGFTTLTGWAAALTAGRHWVIRLARDGNAAEDASIVDSRFSLFVIEYGKTQ